MSLCVLATSNLSSSSSLGSKNSLRSHVNNQRGSSSTVRVAKRVGYSFCEAKQSKEGDSHTIDRRNVLLGMGGLYGATATISGQNNAAVGAPVGPPDLSKCQPATDADLTEKVDCCPPYTSANIIPFVPPVRETLRIRKPAHKLCREDINKFELAIAKMKALPADDPWNFMQQATIHCTYCNGAFDQAGFDGVELQIHGSWLFAPWHRYYIYFWERILGKLIGDPTFAIPYWNWDSPDGMYMPKMYLDPDSPLYNDKRNHDHYGALLDYDYSIKDSQSNPTPDQYDEIKIRNLKKIFNLYTETIGNPSLFLGTPLCAGDTPGPDDIKGTSLCGGHTPGDIAGGLENQHNLLHEWGGPVAPPHHDIGNFATAGRDTMFFGHHANVDRMWDIYSDLRGNKVEFNHPDWLDASFIFYDENRQVVRCKVRDCLLTENLAYTYQKERHAWKDVKRTYKKLAKAIRGRKRSASEGLSLTPVAEFGSKPRALDSTIRVLVPRPKTSRSRDDKDEASEVVVVEGIKFKAGDSTKFDVYIAKPIEGLIGDDLGELVGSFSRVAHTHNKKHKNEKLSKIELGITNLLDDIHAEESESLVVSVVPRHGDVIVGGVRIDLFDADI